MKTLQEIHPSLLTQISGGLSPFIEVVWTIQTMRDVINELTDLYLYGCEGVDEHNHINQACCGIYHKVTKAINHVFSQSADELLP